MEVPLSAPAVLVARVVHSHSSSTASRASASRRSIVKPYSWRTATTVRANQHRLSAGNQSAASCATFSYRFSLGVASVRLSRPRAKRARTSRLAAHSLESCASERRDDVLYVGLLETLETRAVVRAHHAAEPRGDLGLDALRVVVVLPIVGRAPAFRRHHQASPPLSAAGGAGRHLRGVLGRFAAPFVAVAFVGFDIPLSQLVRQ